MRTVLYRYTIHTHTVSLTHPPLLALTLRHSHTHTLSHSLSAISTHSPPFTHTLSLTHPPLLALTLRHSLSSGSKVILRILGLFVISILLFSLLNIYTQLKYNLFPSLSFLLPVSLSVSPTSLTNCSWHLDIGGRRGSVD